MMNNFSRSRPALSRIYWGKHAKEDCTMETHFPHGDVDDLIYQEEWTVSAR